MSADTNKPQHAFYQPAFWDHYQPPHGSPGHAGIALLEFQRYRLMSSTGPLDIRAMISNFEIAILYGVARDYYIGQGTIVDLGPYFGLSTFTLGKGLAANTHVPEAAKAQAIFSYDIFLTGGYEWFLDSPAQFPTGSIFEEYLKIIHDVRDYVRVSPGDLLALDYRAGPIEILFIDVAKTWDLNAFILKRMFPKLIPGRSLVIQQDYIHFHEYWIHLAMEYLHEYFEMIEGVWGGTVVFGCKAVPPAHMLETDLKGLPVAEKDRLLTSAAARMPLSIQQMNKTAHAKMLLDEGQYDQARQMLRSVITTRLTDDKYTEVSELVSSNVRAVDKYFEHKTGQSAL